MNDRTAIVLMNLGGPDSLDAIEPFLFNLFSDPAIFNIPFGRFLQAPLARLIARRRSVARREQYTAIGGRSPILDNTRRQADALAAALAGDGAFDVHICMRYWHPMSDEVVASLKSSACQRVVLLPLYPQYSVTTTGSSFIDFEQACQRHDYAPRITRIEDWYDHPLYLDAVAASIERERARFTQPDPAHIELLLSAHGLPQKIVDKGDPYASHVEATVAGVRERLGWPHVRLCYQSRVGPLKWLQPYTEDVLRELGARAAEQVLVYPIAFVSDHVETLYELGIDYARLAQESGIVNYRVVPALNDDATFIAALRDIVTGHLAAHADGRD